MGSKTAEIDYRVREEDLDDVELDAADVEAARETALDWLDNMDGDEGYSAGWVDGVVMMDRILTDPQYFGLREDGE